MSKKIQPHIAMAMYEQEMVPIRRAQRIAAEEAACYEQHAMEEANRIAAETELSYLEREHEKNMQELQEQDILAEEKKQYDEDFTSEMSVEVASSKPSTQRTHAYRRKQERRSKRKLRNNAETAILNYGKRAVQDMNFTRLSGGEVLQSPKSLTHKSDKLWVKAAKKKLVEKYPT